MPNWNEVHQLAVRHIKHFCTQLMCFSRFIFGWRFAFANKFTLNRVSWVSTLNCINYSSRVGSNVCNGFAAQHLIFSLSWKSFFLHRSFHPLFIFKKCDFKCHGDVAIFPFEAWSQNAINLFSRYYKFTSRKYVLDDIINIGVYQTFFVIKCIASCRILFRHEIFEVLLRHQSVSIEWIVIEVQHFCGNRTRIRMWF